MMQEAMVGGEQQWRAIWQNEGERVLTTADEDLGLVTRFLRGEKAAFDVLFTRHQDYVYHIVYGIVGSAEEARDLTQEVFVQVYRSLPRFRGGSRFATWLYRIAVNRAVDAARSGRKWRFLSLLEDPDRTSRTTEASEEPEAMFERKLERSEVQNILMLCSVTHREVLALRYYRELSVEEIAETLECSVSAAKVRLHRARAAFKASYVAKYGTPAGDRSDLQRTGERDATRTTP